MSGKGKSQENTALSFNDTHREKAPSNKILVLTESMNMDISVIRTSNQLFIRGS